MIKTGLLCLAAVSLLFPAFLFSTVNAKARLSEEQALKVLVSAIQKDAPPGSHTDASCLSISPGESGRDHFDFSVQENYGGTCPGNPNASPRTDRFRVDRSTKKVEWYDPAGGHPRALKAFLNSRSHK
jgi:hypothetical protein